MEDVLNVAKSTWVGFALPVKSCTTAIQQIDIIYNERSGDNNETAYCFSLQHMAWGAGLLVWNGGCIISMGGVLWRGA